ncbi:MAG: RNA polymerase sigma factor RpoD, partial [uncultured Solirubrobacteraceae bacterium]
VRSRTAGTRRDQGSGGERPADRRAHVRRDRRRRRRDRSRRVRHRGAARLPGAVGDRARRRDRSGCPGGERRRASARQAPCAQEGDDRPQAGHDDRLPSALPEGHRQGKVADGAGGGRPRQAHRARRPRRQAEDGRVQPAPRRLDRQELPQPGAAVPGPHPGGNARPRPRGGEVRLSQGLQVLDLRDLVDPPGDRPRARRQGAHDPHPGPRRREAQQDRPRRAQAGHRARPRALQRGDRRGHRDRPRGGRLDQALRAGAGQPREAGRRRGGVGVRPVHRRRARRVAVRARRRDPHQGGAARGAREPVLPRAPRPRAALRPGRRAPPHARRGRPHVQRDARADPPDREPVAQEAAVPRGGPEAPRRRL